MLDATSWVEPTIEWCAAVDALALHAKFQTDGELLTTWPATPFEDTATDCFRLGDEYWIRQPGVGAVRFLGTEPGLRAFPSPDGDARWFQEVIRRSWLPAIYPLWGRQVLHASAVVGAGTGDAVAFTGPTHAGKSTTAYGLGRRRGWRLVSDDALAFSLANVAGERHVRLHPLKNEARLRPASAEHYGRSGDPEPLTWPEHALRLRAVYFLEGDDALQRPAEFTRLSAAEGCTGLLQQAYALSLEIPKYNQQLMRDYVEAAAGVPMFRLRYRRSFDVVEELFEAVEDHLAAEAGVVPVGAGAAIPPAI